MSGENYAYVAAANGRTKYFDSRDRLHRVDGPALISEDGTRQEWYRHGKYHRVDGPAVIRPGSTLWCYGGAFHRPDGPAVERENGHKEWWWYGQRHRLDGPAIIRADGSTEWWIKDARFTGKSRTLLIRATNPNLSDAQAFRLLDVIPEYLRDLITSILVDNPSERLSEKTRAFIQLTH